MKQFSLTARLNIIGLLAGPILENHMIRIQSGHWSCIWKFAPFAPFAPFFVEE